MLGMDEHSLNVAGQNWLGDIMANPSKLAVILHADVVGSTMLVRKDEGLAHERIQSAFELFAKALRLYGGVVREIRGDALVAEFARASDAVLAAMLAQQENVERNATFVDEIIPDIRVGIALGEVVIADATITGAGVVLAQRVEQLADVGAVCVSSAVREALPDRLPIVFKNLGPKELKGFDEPVTVFGVALNSNAPLPEPALQHGDTSGRSARQIRFTAIVALSTLLIGGFLAWLAPWKSGVDLADPSKMTYALPDRPSIAVLPFANMSSDKEQEFFADGITEDIITDLSKLSGLFVVARNSTFVYKGSPVEIRKVAEDLGVRYVLEGSVRRSSDKIRITAQLIDAINGDHLWSERYDRGVKDVFQIQSEVAQKVSKALAVTVKAGEIERLFLRHTTSIEAYDQFLRARRLVDAVGKEPVEEAEALFKQVIALDPDFASAYAGLSFNYSVKARFHFTDSPETDVQHALEFANKAIELDKDLAWGYIALGGAHLSNGDPDAAVESVRHALVIQPNGYEANLFMGLYLQFAGDPKKAIEHLERAQRLNPVDTVRKLAFLGFAYFMNGDYEKSAAMWKRRMDKFPVRNELNWIFTAATFAQLGRMEDASRSAEMVLKINPDFHLAGWRWILTYKSPKDRQHLYDAALKAGIREYAVPSSESKPAG
jgi:adenylate cyclase